MKNVINFTGKTIVLSGVGGIGAATAKLLSSLGAKLILIDVFEEKLNSLLPELDGVGHSCYICDFSNIAEIEPLIQRIILEQGKVDGFVHCVGVGFVRPLKMSKYDFMLNVMNINFFSYVETVRCLTKKNAFNQGMAIVGISAVGAYIGNATKTAYCASKAAMNAASRCLAKELSKKQIRVNTIAPGSTNTPMAQAAKDYRDGTDEQKASDLRQYLGDCEPEDIANAVAYLMSDMSRMITGTCLCVDGGKLSC